MKGLFAVTHYDLELKPLPSSTVDKIRNYFKGAKEAHSAAQTGQSPRTQHSIKWSMKMISMKSE